MQFRRNHPRDERRRRAILDERNSESTPESGEITSGENPQRPSTRNYSPDAQGERRIRVVDMIPQRLWKLSLLHLATLLLVAGLLALHFHFSERFRFADLARSESLGTWFMSLAWLLSSGLAILIYRIRRHRVNDYRGRYRCWLWIAPLFLLAAIDTTANLRTELAAELVSATKYTLAGNEAGWWLAIWGLALAAIVTRMGLETRRSVGTLFFLTLAAGLFSTHVAVMLDWVTLPEEVPTRLAQQGTLLLATWSLTTGLIQYSRFVWLDAQGLIKRRAPRVAKTEQVETDKPAKAKVAAKPAKPAPAKVEKKAVKEEDSAAEESPAKRGWFSWGGTKAKSETESAESSAKPATKTTPAKPAPPKPEPIKPAATKPAAKPKVDTAEEAPAPKRGLFGWLGKSKPVEPDDAEQAKPKPAVAKTVAKPAAKATTPPQNPLANPNLKAAEVSSGSAKPSASTPPATVRMAQDDDDDDASDEEIQRLLDKPDHLLSKAERRRLKKLKRRTTRAA
ncbi:MAG: hypothetical protein WD045_15525 [Pirellulaceae bacterium]